MTRIHGKTTNEALNCGQKNDISLHFIAHLYPTRVRILASVTERLTSVHATAATSGLLLEKSYYGKWNLTYDPREMKCEAHEFHPHRLCGAQGGSRDRSVSALQCSVAESGYCGAPQTLQNFDPSLGDPHSPQ